MLESKSTLQHFIRQPEVYYKGGGNTIWVFYDERKISFFENNAYFMTEMLTQEA